MEENLKEAFFWKYLEEGKIECGLCPHKCVLSNDKIGFCNARKAKNNKLYNIYYGMISGSGYPDPIEKKPLYNFYPGTKVLSFGGVGCNLKCAYCQNSSISQEYDNRYLDILNEDKLLKLVKYSGSEGIAWTYNEPTINFETYYEFSKIAKKNNLYVIVVTNGYINKEPLIKWAEYIDAMNIDVKAFSDEFYKKFTKSSLNPVLDTCKLAFKLNIHIELTYLVIPSLNDSKEEIENYLKWVSNNLGYDVPLHFSRFHPSYKMMDVSPTPPTKIEEIVSLAYDKNFHYVYSGNIYSEKYENTYCPNCKKIIIQRDGYNVKYIKISSNGNCQFCGTKVNLVIF